MYTRAEWASRNHTDIGAFQIPSTEDMLPHSLIDQVENSGWCLFFFFTECSNVRHKSLCTCLKCYPLYLPLYCLSCFSSYVHITSQYNQVQHLRCDFSLGKAHICFGGKVWWLRTAPNSLTTTTKTYSEGSSILTSRKWGQTTDCWLGLFKGRRFIGFNQVLKTSASWWMAPANPSGDLSGFAK